MLIFLAAIGVLTVSGLAALACRRHDRWAAFFGVGGTVVGCALALVPALQVLISGVPLSLQYPWSLPAGSFYVELDALSAFFVIPIALLGALAAVYGAGYLAAWRGKKSFGWVWLNYNLLIAGMLMVVASRNALLFLLAWEIMSLSSFFLVMFESERDDVREAGWTYLIATHLGTAFIVALFVLLGVQSGSLDFDQFAAGAAPFSAGLLFILALIGFGTKAGFMPFHVWLPEAHPAAPSHVSAVMSGVMIKTGIYGLLRIMLFLGPPPLWWGLTLIVIGIVSGILGVLFALAQHDLKRLLAYHSVENIGIIAIGLGLGFVGVTTNSVPLVVLGFGGGLLHVVNHALFKGLLFLGAGSVLHGAGTRDIDHLGGLLKKMRWTGVTFLIGAVAICGLPPLNGFISEFLIFSNGLQGVMYSRGAAAIASLAAIISLALIGGLAAACFTKAYGIVFLGEPRSDHAAHAHECGWSMRIPMAILAALCILVGLLAPVFFSRLAGVIACTSGIEVTRAAYSAGKVGTLLLGVVSASALLLLFIALFAALRADLLSRRARGESGTWDCGYARPTPRMQYTASSYAQPLTDLFQFFLGGRRNLTPISENFPEKASLSTTTPDLFMDRMFRPAFDACKRLFAHLRRSQHGLVQVYVLYVALTLFALLVWYLGQQP